MNAIKPGDTMRSIAITLAATALAASAALAQAARRDQGRDRARSIQDLSGPIAGFGSRRAWA